MRIILFYHSLTSDWNHGNAHFLRGTVTELKARGHAVTVYEPRNGWSRANLLKEDPLALRSFQSAHPNLKSKVYDSAALLAGNAGGLHSILKEADLVIVHEWNAHDLVKAIGAHHAKHPGYHLIFHDTHHRCITDPASMAAYDLRHYDGVLAFGNVVRDIYLQNGWARRAWTWHEAADTRLFKPGPAGARKEGDLVWIGNWGDEERTAELHKFLFTPIQDLGLKARIYGVRYPAEALAELQEMGVQYAGYIPNYNVPAVFSQFKLTVHVPRRPYTRALPGIPTIRPFEAMACGIPLISAPWSDAEHLFTPGQDFLTARTTDEMKTHMHTLLSDPAAARQLAEHARKTILSRHTCAHRVDELMNIVAELRHAPARVFIPITSMNARQSAGSATPIHVTRP
jgi:spore maturation protein CgeB